MTPQPVSITYERGSGVRESKDIPAALVGRAIGDLAGERDVTVILASSDTQGQLMIPIDGALAIIGLDRPDGLLQLVKGARAGLDVHEFIIGGQPTRIEPRYLLELDAAASITQAWLAGGEPPVGEWERR